MSKSNFPQEKFTAPNISGKWRYWGNIQNLTQNGISEITTITGIIDINQDNLFFNYVNKELNLNRIGTFVQTKGCINGKSYSQWEGKVINNTDDATLSLNPYSYKKGKPTKMTSTNIAPGPVGSTSPTYVRTIYYERI
jgi:hypothetical protein